MHIHTKTRTWNVIECSKFYVFTILAKCARPLKKYYLPVMQSPYWFLFTSRVKHKILFCCFHSKHDGNTPKPFHILDNGKMSHFCCNCKSFHWVNNYCTRSISHQREGESRKCIQQIEEFVMWNILKCRTIFFPNLELKKKLYILCSVESVCISSNVNKCLIIESPILKYAWFSFFS